jgi:menaquinone-dependent protoporphyrinogen oxidase
MGEVEVSDVKVLVAVASKHGATEGIARAIAERLRELRHDAEARSVEDAEPVRDVGALVLGSAVYAGSWMKEAMDFAERNADAFSSAPVWLFSSGPLGTEVEDAEEQPRQLDELTRLFKPTEHRVFFGALDKSKLGFAERIMVKAVKAPEGDFRDWDAIRDWADQIASELDRQ